MDQGESGQKNKESAARAGGETLSVTREQYKAVLEATHYYDSRGKRGTETAHCCLSLLVWKCRKSSSRNRVLYVMYVSRLPCVGSAPAKTDGKVGRFKVSGQLNRHLLAVVTGKVRTRHNFLEGSPNIGVGVA